MSSRIAYSEQEHDPSTEPEELLAVETPDDDSDIEAFGVTHEDGYDGTSEVDGIHRAIAQLDS